MLQEVLSNASIYRLFLQGCSVSFFPKVTHHTAAQCVICLPTFCFIIFFSCSPLGLSSLEPHVSFLCWKTTHRENHGEESGHLSSFGLSTTPQVSPPPPWYLMPAVVELSGSPVTRVGFLLTGTYPGGVCCPGVWALPTPPVCLPFLARLSVSLTCFYVSLVFFSLSVLLFKKILFVF